ncbi:Unknown protein [Striga hermonthica]|uniref:DUF1985 domain-containing protein n=1 Tax=Striga hermonthica TaxID=68872 RepID=A0A9N7NDG8_STRHE|nr:Unknown protein [Striga hermonthica]
MTPDTKNKRVRRNRVEAKIVETPKNQQQSDSDFDIHDEEESNSSEEWELLIPNPKPMHIKIINSNDNSKADCAINDIKNSLTEGQLDMFKKTVFGKFLNIPHCKFQTQLVNMLLLREVNQRRSDEVWINFAGKVLRFGIEEFALISGMKCIGSTKKLSVQQVSDGLFDTYFAGFRLSRNYIRSQFLSKVWKNDEDAVKLAKLHLLANFLLGAQDTLLLDRRYLDIIDSSECDEFPWGTEVFEYTIHYLKKTLHNRRAMHTRKDDVNDYLFRCYGFILALQIWFFEICDTADGLICSRIVGEDMPRMVKWEVKGCYNRLFIDRHFMNLSHDKFNNLSPTDFEKSNLHLDGFFKKKNQFLLDDDSSSNGPTHIQSEILNRLDEMGQKQTEMANEIGMLKNMFMEFSTRSATDFAMLKQLILGGNLGATVPNDETGGATNIDVDTSHPDPKNEDAVNRLNADDVDAQVGQDTDLGHDPKGTEEAVYQLNADVDVDNFSPINTQFLAEIDRATEAITKSRSIDKEKKPVGHGLSLNERIGLKSEPVKLSQLSSQPSFDAITKDLHPLQPSRDVHPTKMEKGVVVLTKNAKPVVLNPVVVGLKKRNVVKQSCPFNVPFWKNVFDGETEDFLRWLRMGHLQTFRKISEHE